MIDMTRQLKSAAAKWLLAVAIAGASELHADGGQPPAQASDATPAASSLPDASDDEPVVGLPPRVVVADPHPKLDAAGPTERVQATPLGPQYRLPDHQTLGGWRPPPDLGRADTNADTGNYAFGFRRSF